MENDKSRFTKQERNKIYLDCLNKCCDPNDGICTRLGYLSKDIGSWQNILENDFPELNLFKESGNFDNYSTVRPGYYPFDPDLIEITLYFLIEMTNE